MRRPHIPTPLAIRDLSYNPKTGFYQISEFGIMYQMDLEHTRSLKEYFKGITIRRYGINVSEWYNKLDFVTKKKIFISGNIPTENDFYHDQMFEE